MFYQLEFKNLYTFNFLICLEKIFNLFLFVCFTTKGDLKHANFKKIHKIIKIFFKDEPSLFI